MTDFFLYDCYGGRSNKQNIQPNIAELARTKTNLAPKRDRTVWFENKIHPPAAGLPAFHGRSRTQQAQCAS